MFDKTYFDEVFQRQFTKLGEATCTINLYSGQTFTVRRIEEIQGGYVCIEVFPSEGVGSTTKAARRKVGGTKEVFYDRVAVAYETISHVVLTVSAPAERRIGFPT